MAAGFFIYYRLIPISCFIPLAAVPDSGNSAGFFAVNPNSEDFLCCYSIKKNRSPSCENGDLFLAKDCYFNKNPIIVEFHLRKTSGFLFFDLMADMFLLCNSGEIVSAIMMFLSAFDNL